MLKRQIQIVTDYTELQLADVFSRKKPWHLCQKIVKLMYICII